MKNALVLLQLIFLAVLAAYVSSSVVFADDECLGGHQGGRTFIQKDLENGDVEETGESIAK